MAWAATAEVEQFDEALDWFRGRFPVTEEMLSELSAYAGPRAWTVAGVAQLDIVLDTYESLFTAIQKGTPYDEWQEKISDKLTKAWGRPDSGRLETIFRNATQQAYNAGRERQLTSPEVVALRPYHQFDGIGDSRQSPVCKACNGTILPWDHPWWETHSPQLHHRCRSRKRALTRAQAARKGVTVIPPSEQASGGFGERPDTAQVRPNEAKYPPQLLNSFFDKNENK